MYPNGTGGKGAAKHTYMNRHRQTKPPIDTNPPPVLRWEVGPLIINPSTIVSISVKLIKNRSGVSGLHPG